MTKRTKRIVSGVRTTGRLHLGNYLGSLKNWVDIQNEKKFECFWFLANYHALTTGFEKPQLAGDFLFPLYADLMAIGLDPDESTIFIQSDIPGHSELFLIFSMITPLGWVERNPTVKDMIRDYDVKSNVTYGLLGYPVLQAADIALYKGDMVPVGKDQLPHLELSREVVRRFNNLYGNFFPEPQSKLTDVPLLNGLDGKKMSKSLNNTIYLTSSEEEIEKAVKSAITDPGRVYRKDPGTPEVCNIFSYYKIFAPEHVEEIRKECETAGIGCSQCKKRMMGILSGIISPFREKKEELINTKAGKDRIYTSIFEGRKKAQEVASNTINEIKDIFHFEVKHD
ncbi:MAG: tryptophan--tRNA ligase [Caldisericia bacterium]|nr:tryptophan--tRNA ligase [Caldisericia bacterium]